MHPHEAGGVARVLLVVAPLGDVLAHLCTGNAGCEIWGHVTPLGDVLAHLVGGEVAPLDHRLAQLLARHRRRRQRDGERAPGEQRVGRRALRQREPVDRAERQQVEPGDPALLAREPEAAGGEPLGEDELARRRRELVDVQPDDEARLRGEAAELLDLLLVDVARLEVDVVRVNVLGARLLGEQLEQGADVEEDETVAVAGKSGGV